MQTRVAQACSEEYKEEMVGKQLWVPENYAAFAKEQAKVQEKMKEEFFNSAKGKKYLRFMKTAK